MDEVRPRQYNDATFKVKTLDDDLDIKSVKDIDESELQSYLMGEPVPNLDDLEGEEIQANDEDDDNIPSVKETKPSPKKPEKKEKQKPKEEDTTEEDLDDYLNEIPDERRKGKEKVKETEQSDDDEESIFTTLNRDLVKAGIFSSEDDVEDADGFKQKFVEEMNKGANAMLSQYLSKYGPEYQEAFNQIFVNGVPPETYFKHVERVNDLEGMDLKDTDNQERLLRAYYKQNKYSSERINKKIENLKDSGYMEEEAEAVHEIMMAEERERLDEEAKAAQEEAEQREINRQNYKATINKMLNDKVKARSFDGIPVDPRIAGKIYHNLTAGTWKLPDGRLITEFDKTIMELDMPENFEKKLKLAFLLEKGLDLSDVKKEAVRKETGDTFEGLQRKKKRKEIPSAEQFKSFF